MRRWALVLLLFAAAGDGADPRVQWLRENAATVRSIDPDDTDFADLMPLQQAIGDARIVQLGEQSHSDGATFVAKVRLVRFLHEKLGFNVLAWESGFFDCEEMDTALQGGRVVPDGVFEVWGRSEFVRPLFEYARLSHRTKRPLRMTGVDIQFSGYRHAFPARLFERRARDGPRAEARSREAVFFDRALENLAAYEQLQRLGPDRTVRWNFRDTKMGENLAWLAREWYPDEKIVVWAASGHIARNLAASGIGQYAGLVTMTDAAEKVLGEKTCTVAFTAYGGSIGGVLRQVPSPLALPPAGSIESLLHATGLEFALLNLRALPVGHWLRDRISSRPLGYTPREAKWGDHLDVLFFIDRMFPDRPAR